MKTTSAASAKCWRSTIPCRAISRTIPASFVCAKVQSSTPPKRLLTSTHAVWNASSAIACCSALSAESAIRSVASNQPSRRRFMASRSGLVVVPVFAVLVGSFTQNRTRTRYFRRSSRRHNHPSGLYQPSTSGAASGTAVRRCSARKKLADETSYNRHQAREKLYHRAFTRTRGHGTSAARHGYVASTHSRCYALLTHCPTDVWQAVITRMGYLKRARFAPAGDCA